MTAYAWRRRPPDLRQMPKTELVLLVRHLQLLVRHLEDARYDRRVLEDVTNSERVRAMEVQRQAALHLRTLPPDPRAAQHRLDLSRAITTEERAGRNAQANR
jgi:hypothetical protein